MAGIFISYRRDDSAGYAGRIYDRLSDHFGPDHVFMDVDTIKPGQNFVDAVRQAVGGCDGLVVIIGREWLTISDATGARRLDDPQDIVSLEIATALERGIRVIPVLVQGAPMPAATDFPESLQALALRNAQEISDRSFNSDAQSLIEALEAPEPELPQKNDFVGRQREMAELRAALDAAIGGRGQMVMLSGEPGIGKTRLAQQLASHAESLGAQVMWGWCYEHPGALPYWPYVQPIRTYVENVDTRTIISLLGLGGPAIAEIVPELREKLPDLGQAAAAEPEQARFRLFDSVATFLKNLAQNQPLLFVMDDLHWADSSSLLMLEFLVREIAASPVLVLGTYRDADITGSHSLSQTLGNLVRERHFQRVQLDGLTQEEVGQFVEVSKGVNLTSDILETIHGRTAGNPLFVNEVVELIDPDQMTENTAWADNIPEGVRDAIGSRLGRLSETCNQVLGTASVIGREFDFSLLRESDPNLGADGVLAALDEALKAKVIEELPAVAGRYQFGHALIQLVLYGEMSSVSRLRAHAKIGESLEQIHRTNLDGNAAEIARHFVEAESILGTEKLVHYSQLAGEQALATYAYEEALVHFQRALAVKEQQSMDSETAVLLLGLGRAQSATLDRENYPDAAQSLQRAFNYFIDTKDVDHALNVVEAQSHRVVGLETLMPSMIERALELVPADSHEAGRLLSRYGQELMNTPGGYEAAQPAFSRALAIAQREGDEALEMRTFLASARVDFGNAKWQNAIESSLKAIRLAPRVNDPAAELDAHRIASISLRNTGDPTAAQFHAAAGLTLADKMRNRLSSALVLASNSTLFQLAGDWATSREYTDRGLKDMPKNQTLLASRIMLEFETGDFNQGKELLDRMVESMAEAEPGPTAVFAYTAAAIPLVARIEGGKERFDVANVAARNFLSFESLSPMFASLVAMSVGMMAAEQGDRITVTEQYTALLPERGTILTALLPSVDRILGIMSTAVGDLDQAVSHFEEALAFCRKAGYRPELAWTCCDYADTLLERDGEGDQATATALLDESLAISSELGMRPLMERVEARQKALET